MFSFRFSALKSLDPFFVAHFPVFPCLRFFLYVYVLFLFYFFCAQSLGLAASNRFIETLVFGLTQLYQSKEFLYKLLPRRNKFFCRGYLILAFPKADF